MYTQNVSIPPDYFGHWQSTVPSQADGNYDWQGHTGNSQERTGKLFENTKHLVIYSIRFINFLYKGI